MCPSIFQNCPPSTPTLYSDFPRCVGMRKYVCFEFLSESVIFTCGQMSRCHECLHGTCALFFFYQLYDLRLRIFHESRIFTVAFGHSNSYSVHNTFAFRPGWIFIYIIMNLWRASTVGVINGKHWLETQSSKTEDETNLQR